ILRIFALVLVSGCCWGVYSLVRLKTKEGEELEELKLRKDKMLGLSRMAGEIAHEIKNPLSIVNNAAYYILKHVDKGNERIRQQVKTIQEEVLRADKILTNMLDFAKLSNVKISRINVQDVIDETLELMLAQHSSKKVKVIKEYEKVPPELLFDEGQFRQVIRNIVKNALAAMSDKKGVLLVRLEYIKSGSIKVLFSDTGGGFGDVPAERLFSAFYTTKPDGTGLGLPVVRNIVESYNGTIDIENWKDRNDAGAVVTVVFPMRTARSNRTGE
ncbi:MAG: ATP-binding protein, partial [Candidatus Theseobacter exili]|nr:ATP-binding protein [Candidatus Theseobacter exili]